MQHQDAEVSDIIVVLKKECAERLDEVIEKLKNMEMEIETSDPNNGVVAGTVFADKLPHIRTWPCVEYVRVEFTYVADYPVGDPRNQDPPDGDAEDDDLEDAGK